MDINFQDIFNNIQFRNELWIVIVPSLLMVLDILTGVIHAWATGHLKSYKMREGLNHKSGELCVLLVGEILSYGMQLPIVFMIGVSVYVIFMELVSIMENLDKMGVKFPKFIRNAFRNAKDKLENSDNPLNPEKKEDTKDADSGGDSGDSRN